jgi:endonuclease/exonuclease/phosphatase family metal-dependent hydrolase
MTLLLALLGLALAAQIQPVVPPAIRYATYNIGGGEGNGFADAVESIVHLCLLRCHVIGLNEAGDRAREIAEVCKRTGYHPVRVTDDKGAERVVLLVRPGVTVERHGTVFLNGRIKFWIGRNVAGERGGDGFAEHKWLVWALVKLPNGRRRVVGVCHLVPSLHVPEAKALHAIQVKSVVLWWRLRTLPMRMRRASPVVVGDFNATPSHDNLAPLRAVARGWTLPSHGGDRPKRAIDYVWLPPNHSAEVYRLQLASDHWAVIVDDHGPVDDA